MNREIFAHMQGQMAPHPSLLEEVRTAAASSKPRKAPAWKYASAAAVVALAVAAYPAYRVLHPVQRPLHSYVVVEGGGATQELTATTVEGDQGASTGGGGGEMAPGGALVGEIVPVTGGDVAVQEEAVAAYQNLMAYFQETCGPDGYPDWYGGSYIQGEILIVNIVEEFEPADKEFFLEIQGWAKSGSVGFGNVKYSYAYLRQLQDQVDQELLARGLAVGSGVNQTTGMLEVSLPEANEEALALLAQLDPDGETILVEVGVTAVTDELPRKEPVAIGADVDGRDYAVPEPAEEPIPEPAVDPTTVEMPGARVEDLRQAKLSRFAASNTPAYDPQK